MRRAVSEVQVRGFLPERIVISPVLDPYMSLRALATYSGLSKRTLRTPTWIESQESAGAIRASTSRLPDGRQLGDLLVNQITREMLGAVIQAIKSAGRSLSLVKGVRNPVLSVKRPTKITAFFTQEEGPKLMDAAAHAGPSVLAQPVECGRFTRDVPGLHRRQPAPARIARAHDRADASDQCAVSVCGDGGGAVAVRRSSPQPAKVQ